MNSPVSVWAGNRLSFKSIKDSNTALAFYFYNVAIVCFSLVAFTGDVIFVLLKTCSLHTQYATLMSAGDSDVLD